MDSGNVLRRVVAGIALSLAIATQSTSATAAWPPLGLRLCNVAGEQIRPISASDGFGGAFVCWADYRGVLVDGEFDADLYVQHVSAAGEIAPSWPLDGLEISSAPGNQWRLVIAADGFGGCYVLWELAASGNIYLTRFSENGQRTPGWPLPGLKIGDRLGWPSPDLIPDASGTYIVFDSELEGMRHVYVQRVALSGVVESGWPSAARRIGNLSTVQSEGKGVPDGSGGLIVLWEELRSSPTTDIFATRVLHDGSTAPGWPENGIDVCTAPGRQVSLQCVSDGAGGALLAWTDYRSAPPGAAEDSQFSDVYAHHVLSSATVDPLWPADGLPICVQPKIQSIGEVCTDTQGGMFVNWVDYRTNVSDVYVQRIRADGSIASGWPANGKFGGGDSGFDGVIAPPAPDGAGGVYLAWQRESFPRQTFTQHLTASGENAPGWQPTGNQLVTNNAESLDPWLIADGYGGAIVAWSDTRICGSCGKVFAQRIGGNGPTSVALSLVEANAEPGVAHLVWQRGGVGSAAEFDVERGTDSGVFTTIATIHPDGQGRLAYDDHVDEPARYFYRLRYQDDGQTRLSPTAEVDVPSPFVLALSGFAPNPALRASPNVSFSLPRRASGTLALYDVTGRVVIRHDLSSLAAGRHTVRVSDRLNSGVYWMRLTHDGRQLSARGAIIR